MTDKELRDAAVARLKLTTVGYKNKHWTIPPQGTNWDAALDYLAQIGGTPTPPPSSSHMLPGSRVTLDPGEIAAWVVCDSPTSQITGPNRDGHRIVRWDAGGFYSAKKTYALVGFRVLSGFPGRFIDFHTSPSAVGGWRPPGNPAGVAPVALDLRNDSKSVQIVNQPDWPNHATTIIPAAEFVHDKWYWLWVEIVWGRPGSLKVWLAGEDTPRVNRSASTHDDTTNLLSLWDGAYYSSPGAPARSEIELAATRLGRTPKECFEDTPHLFVREPAGSPGGSAVGIADINGGNVPVPAELRWST